MYRVGGVLIHIKVTYVKSELHVIAHSLLNQTTIWNAMNFWSLHLDVMVSAHYIRLDRFARIQSYSVH